MKMKKWKYIALSLTVGIIFFGGFNLIYASNDEDGERQELHDYIEIQCDSMQVKEVVGEDSIIPDVYEQKRCYNLIGDNANVDYKITDDIISREALYIYAKKMGFSLSESELDSLMQEFFEEYKNAEEFQEIESLYESFGTTFEKNAFDNIRLYETKFTVNKLYDYMYIQYEDGNTSVDGKDFENWEEYWNEIEHKALLEYKGTENYAKMTSALEASLEMVDKATFDTGSMRKKTKNFQPDYGEKSSETEEERYADTRVFNNLSYNHTILDK